MVSYVDLTELTPDVIHQENILKIKIANQIDNEKLSLIHQKIMTGTKVFLHFCGGLQAVLTVLKQIPNAQHISLTSNDGDEINNIDFLQEMNLMSLKLGLYVKKNTPFKSLTSTQLEELQFQEGLGHKSQYLFLNQQHHLRRLRLKSLDLDLINKKEVLDDLYVQSVLKSEQLLLDKFPNLIKLHLHGLSRMTNHSFIEPLQNLEVVSINYNSHLTSFPQLKNPSKVKSISMLSCPNFTDIESLLVFENLERLALTSYDKPLQLSTKDFAKLQRLNKLKTVYTQWGRKPQNDLANIESIYQQTGWKNSNF